MNILNLELPNEKFCSGKFTLYIVTDNKVEK